MMIIKIAKGSSSSEYTMLPAGTKQISIDASHGNHFGLLLKMSNANGRSRSMPIHQRKLSRIDVESYPIIEFKVNSVDEDLTIKLGVN